MKEGAVDFDRGQSLRSIEGNVMIEVSVRQIELKVKEIKDNCSGFEVDVTEPAVD